jgi:hypothetical protein
LDGNTKKEPNASSMLAMVRFGADKILATKNSGHTITDESIEEILTRSREKTRVLEERLESMDEASLRDFKFDAPPVPVATLKSTVTCATDFEGKDYR